MDPHLPSGVLLRVDFRQELTGRSRIGRGEGDERDPTVVTGPDTYRTVGDRDEWTTVHH